MVSGSEAGKFARAQFTELVEIIEKSCSFEHDKVTQWQNSGTYVSYLWCQMKRKEHKDSQISMSLFAEKGNDFLRFRLSIELAMAAASTSDITTYAGFFMSHLIRCSYMCLEAITNLNFVYWMNAITL